MNHKQQCLTVEPSAKCECVNYGISALKYHINHPPYPKIIATTAKAAWQTFYHVLRIREKL